MKRPIILLLLLSLALSSATNDKRNDEQMNAHKLLDNMFASVAKIQQLTFRVKYQERVYETGKFRNDSSCAKYQKSPKRIYIKMSNGAELLWGPDMNDGDVLVHPNAFPWVNLNLDPNGYWMRKNQHHCIDAMGFEYFALLLKSEMNKAGTNFNSHFLYQGEITYSGFKCYKMTITDNDFKYISYTVLKDETILTIAKKLCLNEYMILKHNTDVDSYTDVKEGQTIQVPSNYAKQVSLYVDENSMLPLMMRVDDEKGLFEEYDYRDLKINPSIQSTEFTRDYKDYHF